MVEKDYLDIDLVTPIKVFNVALADKGQEFLKKGLPFDEQCARLDFRDKLDKAEKESERRYGFIKHDEIKIEIGNLDKYGDANRFVIDFPEQEQYVDKVIEGSRTQVLHGYMRAFRCKERGHGISVFIPIGEWKKEVKKEE